MQTSVPLMLFIASVESLLLKQYHYIPLEKNWADAHAYCTHNYTDLAYIDSLTDRNDLLTASMDAHFEYAWIGLQRDADGGATGWKWTGREGAVNYTDWETDKAIADTETKVRVGEDGDWADVAATSELHFFCVHTFHVQETEKSWEEALQHCRRAHSDLITLQQHTSNPSGRPLWVGLRFLAGRWLWVSGRTLWYRGWGAADGGEPTEHQCPVKARCGALGAEGVWEARDCLETLSFVCQNGI